MKCEACQNRILALEYTPEPTEELREHLASCAACRTAQKKAVKLDALLARLPVPSSQRAKAKLIASLNDQLSVPSSKVPAYRQWMRSPLPGVAALVVLGIGGFFYFSKKQPQPELAEKPRHELLNKELGNVVKLARADSAPDRLRVWTDWATDLRGETRDLYKVAPAEELSSLARMYERAVNEGIVKQATRLPEHMDAEEEQKLLQAADPKLAEGVVEAERLHGEAPPQAQKYLKQMAETSREGRRKLEPILKGV